MSEQPVVLAALAELQQACGAAAVAFVPAMIRGTETSPRVHGIEAVGDNALVRLLTALDGLLLERVLPMETMPLASRLEICLDDLPPPPLAKTLSARGTIQAAGTSLVDEDARLVGIALLLWCRTQPVDARALRRLRRGCDSLVPAIREAWLAAMLDVPATAVVLYDARGVATHVSSEARAWLALPTVRAAARACLAELAGSGREQIDQALPGALVSAIRLDGDGEHCTAVTLAGARHPRYGGLLNLSRTQRRIAVLAALGLRVHEIAREVERGRETVRSHLRTVYRALGARGRGDLRPRMATRG